MGCDATPTPERATVAGEDEERWRQGRPPGTPVSSGPAGSFCLGPLLRQGPGLSPGPASPPCVGVFSRIELKEKSHTPRDDRASRELDRLTTISTVMLSWPVRCTVLTAIYTMPVVLVDADHSLVSYIYG